MADSGFASLTHDSVSIVDVETVRDVTFYVIVVTLPGGQTWKVKHRYSDFKDLHDKLLTMFAIGCHAGLLNLPPRRLFNNHDPGFIKKRRNELEEYLRSVILNLVPPCPLPLKNFLVENRYDFRDKNSMAFDSVSSDLTCSTVTPVAEQQFKAGKQCWGSVSNSPRLADKRWGVGVASDVDAFGMPLFGDDAAEPQTQTASRYKPKDFGVPASGLQWYDGDTKTHLDLTAQKDHIPSPEASQPTPSNTLWCDSTSRNPQSISSDIKAFLDPGFQQLHSSLGKQIKDTYHSHSLNSGTTVFVDDLITF